MAQIWNYLTAANWPQHLATAWHYTDRSARAAFVFLAALPTDCKLASMHATLLCMGEVPTYVTPGFGPFSLAWGWVIVGMFVGAAVTYLILASMGMLRQRPLVVPLAMNLPAAPAPVPVAQALLPVPPAPQFVAPAGQERAELLDYIAHGGTEALRDLASSAGVGEAEFLVRAFGVQGSSAPSSSQPSYLTQRVARASQYGPARYSHTV